jgi:hypothetical protein
VKGDAGVTAIRHDPARHLGQAVEQGHGVGQHVRLSRRDPEGDGATTCINA